MIRLHLCPQCKVLKKSRKIDALVIKQQNAEVFRLMKENAELQKSLFNARAYRIKLEAVVVAAEACGHLPRKWGSESCCAMCEALAALREWEKTK